MAFVVSTVSTTPFLDQKPGTSGLRKKVVEFTKENYTENFIQCILSAIEDSLPGSTLVVGGDGRYGLFQAIYKIVKMAAANKVKKLIVGQHGILSTPAVSCIIRKYATDGGIILTASHNPGGPDGDFGIKFNMDNGGPAPTEYTNRIFSLSKSLTSYAICKDLSCNFSKIGVQRFSIEGGLLTDFEVEVIDSVADYTAMIKDIFDFPSIKKYLKKTKILINSLHGVTGPYVERIFGDELGVSNESFLKTNILPDFGGGHPDPNLTYAADLVEGMADETAGYGFGAAFDGDGDRNMILGAEAFFVTPCDSLAVIAANLDCIPYFKERVVNGYARSMPTSSAVDRVAVAKGKDCYETPTGWKFFGNLLDAGSISLCGEESFGTGSDHIREKDGIWAAMAWLQILASKNASSVKEVLEQHWKKYGRDFFTRLDYEQCDSEPCEEMMKHLQYFVNDPSNIGRGFFGKEKMFVISYMDDFSYVDPIDDSVTSNQGIRIFFEQNSRIVIRLSGTGSSGSTVRIYVESYESEEADLLDNTQEVLAPCIDVALQISKLSYFTGREVPNVVT